MEKALILLVILSTVLTLGIVFKKTYFNTPTKSNNDDLCLVTVNGIRYNVTELATTHSGGNIFNCNTDMSDIYKSRHGNKIDWMNKYVYTGSDISISGKPQVTNTYHRKEEKDDD